MAEERTLEDLAREAFGRSGYDAVSLRGLLTLAGVMTLPRRYKNKAALFEAVTGSSAPPTRQARMVAAATDAFERLGYFKVTVKTVAAAAAVSPLAVTNAYPDKAELWRKATGREPPPGALARGWGGSRLVHAAETRERAVAEAQRLFNLHAYDAVGIRTVAASVGLSTGAVMGHFPTKADLWRAAMACEPPVDGMLTRHAPQLLAALRALLSHEPEQPSRRARADWRRARRLAEALGHVR